MQTTYTFGMLVVTGMSIFLYKQKFLLLSTPNVGNFINFQPVLREIDNFPVFLLRFMSVFGEFEELLVFCLGTVGKFEAFLSHFRVICKLWSGIFVYSSMWIIAPTKPGTSRMGIF